MYLMKTNKTVKGLKNYDLVYSLRRLNDIAKTVAHAKNPSEAEYFTMRYLRPQIEETEEILANTRQIFKH